MNCEVYAKTQIKNKSSSSMINFDDFIKKYNSR